MKEQPKSRENGFYHVKWNGGWIVAEWSKPSRIWTSSKYTTSRQDCDFEEIDERKISRVSGEPPKPDQQKVLREALGRFISIAECRSAVEGSLYTEEEQIEIRDLMAEKVSGEAKTPEPTIQEIKNSMRHDYLDAQAKDNTVKEFTEMTSKHIMTFFYLMGLKSHIESMIVNQANGEEFIFSFQTVEYFKQRNKTEVTVPTPSDEEIARKLWDLYHTTSNKEADEKIRNITSLLK